MAVSTPIWMRLPLPSWLWRRFSRSPLVHVTSRSYFLANFLFSIDVKALFEIYVCAGKQNCETVPTNLFLSAFQQNSVFVRDSPNRVILPLVGILSALHYKKHSEIGPPLTKSRIFIFNKQSFLHIIFSFLFVSFLFTSFRIHVIFLLSCPLRLLL